MGDNFKKQQGGQNPGNKGNQSNQGSKANSGNQPNRGLNQDDLKKKTSSNIDEEDLDMDKDTNRSGSQQKDNKGNKSNKRWH